MGVSLGYALIFIFSLFICGSTCIKCHKEGNNIFPRINRSGVIGSETEKWIAGDTASSRSVTTRNKGIGWYTCYTAILMCWAKQPGYVYLQCTPISGGLSCTRDTNPRSILSNVHIQPPARRNERGKLVGVGYTRIPIINLSQRAVDLEMASHSLADSPLLYLFLV